MADRSSAGTTASAPASERVTRARLLLDGLDDEQRHAVTTPSRTLVIRAAAGAGKTRVLTRRVAYRDAIDDLDARRALCVTFTREAAAELRARLRTLGLRDVPAAGTFHGIASALLRVRWHDQRMAVPGLVSDRADLVARADRRLGRDRFRLTRVVAEIDWARARGVTAQQYPVAALRAHRRPGVEPEAVVHAFEAYEVAKRAARVIDFDDLLERCADAFERDATFAAAQRWRFQHLFVDEFQDVNPLQFRLLRAWLGDRRDLCVVGDPNQAIYGWNGSDPTLFDRVEELLGDARPGTITSGLEIVHLSTNHRSTPQVVAVSTAALLTTPPLEDPRSVEPPVASAPPTPGATRAAGPVPTVVACEDEADEALTIAATLRRWHDRGVRWGEQAVLVRTNALARSLRQSLVAAGVPVAETGRPGAHRWANALPAAATWNDLLDTLAELDGAAAGELAVLAAEYADLDPRPAPAGFAAWLGTLRSRASVGPDGTTPTTTDAVTVSTFHAAKGREWRAVAVAGLEAGIVPLGGASNPGTAAEAEERRLCYVALSRATELLALTWATTRTVKGRVVTRERSPYLGRVAEACRGLAATERPVAPPSGLRRGLDAAHSIRTARQREARGGHGDDDLVEPAGHEHDLAAARRAALQRWRARQARGATCSPAVVLSDLALDDLARRPPVDLVDLAERPVIGPIVAARFGADLLALVGGQAGRGLRIQSVSNSTSTTV